MAENTTTTGTQTGSTTTNLVEAGGDGADFANALIPKDFQFSGGNQVGLVVEYVSSAGIGQLVVTDVPLGEGAMYVTAPITLKGAALVDLLKSKGVSLEDGPLKRLKNVLNKASLTLDAFYYGKSDAQPFILSVSIEFKGGLIDSIVNDSEAPVLPPKPSDYDEPGSTSKTAWDGEKAKYDAWAKSNVPVSQLFDINSGSVRIVKCSNTGPPKAKLMNYLNSLRR